MDFTLNYSLDTEETFGHNWGTFDYRIGGSWLIEQKFFNDAVNTAAFTETSSTLFYRAFVSPRV